MDELVNITVAGGDDIRAKAVALTEAAAGVQHQVQVVTGGLHPVLRVPASLARKAGITPDPADAPVARPDGTVQASQATGVETGAGAQAGVSPLHRNSTAAAGGAKSTAAAKAAGKATSRRTGGND